VSEFVLAVVQSGKRGLCLHSSALQETRLVRNPRFRI